MAKPCASQFLEVFLISATTIQALTFKTYILLDPYLQLLNLLPSEDSSAKKKQEKITNKLSNLY